MNINTLKSLPFFSLIDQIKLVIGLLFPSVFQKNDEFKRLLVEKRGIDFLFRNNKSIKSFGQNTILITGNKNINSQYKFYLRRYTSDLDVYRQLYDRPDYPIIINKIEGLLGGADKIQTIVDGGAYIGLSTFYWARSFPNAKVVAIEAETSNFELLTRNVSINNLEAVYLENKAVWYKSGELSITKDKMDKRPWAFAVEESVDNNTERIQSISLSKLREDHNLGTIDVLKLDIEGAEREVFLKDRQIAEVLKNTRIILCELHYFDSTKNEILNKISKAGFSYETIGEDHFFINKNLVPENV